MENFRKKWIEQYLKEIDEKYEHLDSRERQDLIYLRNKKENMNSNDFNKLKAFAESCRVKF